MLDCCKIANLKWPVARKCCFCVPIRKGVTIFGYFNLVLSLLSLPLLVFLLVDHVTTEHTTPNDGGGNISPTVYLSLTIAFMFTDVAMTAVLLIGVHKKNKQLLQIYFYFGAGFQMVTLSVDLMFFDYQEYVENLIYLFFLSLNIYQLFLVYNLVYILDECAEVQYVVHQDERRRIV